MGGNTYGFSYSIPQISELARVPPVRPSQLKAETQRTLAVPAGVSLPLHWQVATASTAGAAASFLTNPLDLAKLRLQVQRGLDAANGPPRPAAAAPAPVPPSRTPAPTAAASAAATAAAASAAAATVATATATPFRYRNLAHGLSVIVRTEGWRALFRGAGGRMAFHASSTAITMTAFENCRDAYRRLLAATAEV